MMHYERNKNGELTGYVYFLEKSPPPPCNPYNTTTVEVPVSVDEAYEQAVRDGAVEEWLIETIAEATGIKLTLVRAAEYINAGLVKDAYIAARWDKELERIAEALAECKLADGYPHEEGY